MDEEADIANLREPTPEIICPIVCIANPCGDRIASGVILKLTQRT